jgi:hypothetical protein
MYNRGLDEIFIFLVVIVHVVQVIMVLDLMGGYLVHIYEDIQVDHIGIETHVFGDLEVLQNQVLEHVLIFLVVFSFYGVLEVFMEHEYVVLDNVKLNRIKELSYDSSFILFPNLLYL